MSKCKFYKDTDDYVSDYVKKRNDAIRECWRTSSVSPLTKFIKKMNVIYDLGFKLEDWNKASSTVKWLTICKMTLSITSMDAIYQEWAKSFIERYRRKHNAK